MKTENPYRIPTIAEICERYGLKQKALANRFGIPRRTIESWTTGDLECPAYVRNMMVEILDIEKVRNTTDKVFVVPDHYEELTVGMLLDFLADAPRDAGILCGEHENSCDIYPRMICKGEYLVGLFVGEPPDPEYHEDWESRFLPKR